MREAAILKQLNHKNIIKLEDVFLTDERCYFLLEYMDEDLKRYLDKNRPLDGRIIKVEKFKKKKIFFLYKNFLSTRILCINYSMRFFIVINIVLFIEI